MDLDYFYLSALKEEHAAFKLLRADNAALILAFVYKAFTARSKTEEFESELIKILDDLIFEIKESLPEATFQDKALYYLNDWTQKGYLHRFYPRLEKDEALYDITPATQKALSFVQSLHNYNFVATESRLLSIIQLLEDLKRGTREDISDYIDDLKAQRRVLDEKIKQALKGKYQRLTKTQILDRFQQFEMMARSLTADFRQVEYNFAELSVEVRKKIAQWTESKGKLLEEYLTSYDIIENTDQGRSVYAFSRLLLSSEESGKLISLLHDLYSLKDIQALESKDKQVQALYGNLINSENQISRASGLANKRIRQFVEQKVYLENRGMNALFNEIFTLANEISNLPQNKLRQVFELDLPQVEVNLPLDRELYRKKQIEAFDTQEIEERVENQNELFAATLVDEQKLIANIDSLLTQKSEVSLQEVIDTYPLEYGLTELTSYVKVAYEYFVVRDLEDEDDLFFWPSFDATQNLVFKEGKVNRLMIRRR